VTGIAQGTAPASVAGPGGAVISNPYVLKQTYSVTNISAEPLLGVELYQFLHGLNSTRAVYDDRDYGEASVCGGMACSAYHYDTTMMATTRAFIDLDRPFEDAPGEPPRAINIDGLFGFAGIDDAFLESLLGLDEAGVEAAFAAIFVTLDPDTVAAIAAAEVYAINDDIISFHSREAPIPFGWETGRYGVEGADSHVVGKPSTGVHLSVEAASLSGVDEFDPGDKWVSGAQVYLLGDLAADETASFEVLLSISTAQSLTAVPLPASLPLLVVALTGLATLVRRR
ncbi:MAG: VPLPA-CTERM sorting domain-containing protein, partial [Gammaproteobacteria bacterium]|nr:VPLPA-CTERM sorting domain-containing protein [Gammaproteobacteria bacterium]